MEARSVSETSLVDEDPLVEQEPSRPEDSARLSRVGPPQQPDTLTHVVLDLFFYDVRENRVRVNERKEIILPR